MMPKLLSLEDFDAPVPVPDTAQTTLTEEEWLKVFEKGYKDGWEDAVKTHSKTQEQIKADLANSLEQIAFTLAEARARALKDIKPLIEAVLDTVLKPSLDKVLMDQLVAQIDQIARDATDRTVEIAVATENLERLQVMTQDRSHLPVRFVAETTLGPGEAFLRFGAQEQKFDLPGALSVVRQIVDEFFDTVEPEKDRIHG